MENRVGHCERVAVQVASEGHRTNRFVSSHNSSLETVRDPRWFTTARTTACEGTRLKRKEYKKRNATHKKRRSKAER